MGAAAAVLGCAFLKLGNGLDFAEHALGQGLDGYAGASGLGDEVLGIDSVEVSKVAHVCQKADGLDDVLKLGAAGLQNGLDVFAGLLRLGGDALAHAAVGGVDRDLAGAEDEVAADVALGVGADGGGGLFGTDDEHDDSSLQIIDGFALMIAEEKRGG